METAEQINKIKRGRPEKSYSYSIPGIGPAPIQAVLRWRSQEKARLRTEGALNQAEIKPIDLSGLKASEGINKKIDEALEEFNQYHFTSLSKKDFITLLLLRSLQEIN